jgi:hypothetical protein
MSKAGDDFWAGVYPILHLVGIAIECTQQEVEINQLRQFEN